jgi:hypothetical protein
MQILGKWMERAREKLQTKLKVDSLAEEMNAKKKAPYCENAGVSEMKTK